VVRLRSGNGRLEIGQRTATNLSTMTQVSADGRLAVVCQAAGGGRASRAWCGLN
jgi:hypothetical protein